MRRIEIDRFQSCGWEERRNLHPSRENGTCPVWEPWPYAEQIIDLWRSRLMGISTVFTAAPDPRLDAEPEWKDGSQCWKDGLRFGFIAEERQTKSRELTDDLRSGEWLQTGAKSMWLTVEPRRFGRTTHSYASLRLANPTLGFLKD